MSDKARKTTKTDAQWRAELTPEQYSVTREKGTERAFTGCLWNHKGNGTYACVACDAVLFDSADKYDSGSGWPSFSAPGSDARVVEKTDTTHGMRRTEIVCGCCDAHLGHLFPDGPRPTGMRYCINSAALTFKPREGGD